MISDRLQVTARPATPGSTGAVQRATADDAAHLAGVLARAFYDDPPMRWVLPDDSRRMAVLERGSLLFLRRLYLPQNQCWTTASGNAVATWELPGQWKLGVGQQLRLLPAMLRVYGRGLSRVASAITALERDHPSEPHMYLPFVGVEPNWQGRGLGTAVLRPVLDRCDAEGLPAYLEASTPRNRELYRRLGFDVTAEIVLGKGSPPVWRMWRAPHAPSESGRA
jgi:GNAT superfamily N-acetyltransferase